MSDFQIITAVRERLLNADSSQRIHLAIPPNALYPLILIELEEVWSPYVMDTNMLGMNMQTRVKFKVGIYSHSPGMEEAASLSSKVREVLEGATLWLSEKLSADKTATVRFLGCVTEPSGKVFGHQPVKAVYHFYDSLVRG
ncbi:MAG: hypothetical protein FJX71_00470 [Alphaproteobacteria bacterium]|nr:hypothetical protein [Alphaproteobacteria bacterium]